MESNVYDQVVKDHLVLLLVDGVDRVVVHTGVCVAVSLSCTPLYFVRSSWTKNRPLKISEKKREKEPSLLYSATHERQDPSFRRPFRLNYRDRTGQNRRAGILSETPLHTTIFILDRTGNIKLYLPYLSLSHREFKYQKRHNR